MSTGTTKVKLSKSDVSFEIVIYIVLSLVTLAVLYPLYFIIIASFSDPTMVASGDVIFIPKGINFDGYVKIFEYEDLWIGYRNSIFYTVLGTILNVAMTFLAAYPLSKYGLRGRKYILFYLMFTMYFSGGLIPSYLINDMLGLVNNWLIIIVAGMVGISNVIVCITFLKSSIPGEIFEAASIDGASHFKAFTTMAIPLSKSVLAVMFLRYGVGNWNEFWTAMIYLTDRELFPLQLILREILTQNEIDPSMFTDFEDEQRLLEQRELLKYGVIIVSTIPMLIIYPFVQKHFVKGIMIGSLKG